MQWGRLGNEARLVPRASSLTVQIHEKGRHCSSASVYYTERKVKKKKWGRPENEPRTRPHVGLY